MRFLFGIILFLGLQLLVLEVFGGPLLTVFLQRMYGWDVKIGRVSLLSGMKLFSLDYTGPDVTLHLDEIQTLPLFSSFGMRLIAVRGGEIELKLDKGNAKGAEVGFNPAVLALVPLRLPVEKLSVTDLRIGLERDGESSQIELDKLLVYRPDLKRGYYDFHLNGRLFRDGMYGSVEFSGWLDWDKKNALFVLKGDHIPLGFFRSFLEMPELEGLLSLRIEGEAEDNVLVLKNWFGIKGLEIGGAGALTGLPLVSAVLGPLSGIGEELELQFKVTTRLDNPQIDFRKEILSALRRYRQGQGIAEEGDSKAGEVTGEIYDIINGLVGIVGSVLGD